MGMEAKSITGQFSRGAINLNESKMYSIKLTKLAARNCKNCGFPRIFFYEMMESAEAYAHASNVSI